MMADSSRDYGIYMKRQLDTLRSCPFIRFDIANAVCTSSVNNNMLSPDRFTLVFPFCGKLLRWELIMYIHQPSSPPDFIFPEGKESFITLASYPSLLSAWDLTMSSSLARIIVNVIRLYSEYEFQRVKAESMRRDSLQFAFSAVQDIAGTECALDAEDAGMGVRMLVPLDVDLARKLAYSGGVNEDVFSSLSSQASARLSLLVWYEGEALLLGDASAAPHIRLVVPHFYRESFPREPKLPVWTAPMSLVEYIPLANEAVASFVDSIVARRNVLVAFQTCFGSPLEYDSFFYSRISFTFDDEPKGTKSSGSTIGAYFVHFGLPDTFPADKPTIQMQSFSTVGKDGFPVTKDATVALGGPNKGNHYPYSPRWHPDELAKRISKYLLEQLPEFVKIVTAAAK